MHSADGGHSGWRTVELIAVRVSGRSGVVQCFNASRRYLWAAIAIARTRGICVHAID